ncbi:MAG: hypothetical protein J0I17_10315 ['Candidatus Kapabacteria' thiocyanatum]|nr:hypothetical protein ['Candidatus Kapabacteria' thiocyanatum]
MQQQIFKYQDENHFSDVRTVEIDGEIWFVARDVATLLGYTTPAKAVADHCREKGIKKNYMMETSSGVQGFTLINEPNVYRLISRSKLPSAEKFEAWVFEEVIPQIRKQGFYGKIDRTALPNFISRYKDNYHKLDHNYFSVISEMYARLYIALEKVGYSIPDKGVGGKQMMPDISVGRGFASFLKKQNSEFYNQHRTYWHSFPDGRPDVEANMYHIDALPIFIRYIHEKWIPENAHEYFKQRDPLALDYLPKLLN